jgi:sirohydrochlorin ferrochelatase
MNILLAHGSPDTRHGERVRQLAGRVSEMLGEQVGTSFLSEKSLPEGARVLPLFLGGGKHVRVDAPQLIRASGCEMLPPLENQAARIAEMAFDLVTIETRRINALFVIYSFSGFEKLAAELYKQSKRCSKVALAALHTEPSIKAVLDFWQNEGMKQVTLQPMLLFEGRTLDMVQAEAEADQAQSPQITLGPVLAKHEAMPTLIADCLRR